MLRALSFSGCLWYALDNSVPKRGKKMVTVHMTAVLPGDVQQVWTVVTGVEDYSWRSDLSRTEVLSAEQFVEHTQTGDQTLFTITAAEPGRRWELDMENRRMRGHWVGLFSGKGAETAIQFTETLHVKTLCCGPLSNDICVSSRHGSWRTCGMHCKPVPTRMARQKQEELYF